MQLVSGTKQQNLQCVFLTDMLTVPLSYLQLIVAVTLRWYYSRWWQSVNWICNFLLPIYHLTLVGRVALCYGALQRLHTVKESDIGSTGSRCQMFTLCNLCNLLICA